MRLSKKPTRDPSPNGDSSGDRSSADRSLRGLWRRVTGSVIPAAFRKIDRELLDELEERLIMADFGVSASERLVAAAEEAARKERVRDEAGLRQLLADELRATFAGDNGAGLAAAEDPPAVYLFAGVNGAGKTTTIGKVAHRLAARGQRVVLAASDTFRAGAAEQLALWAERTNAEIVAGRFGSDPAAVAFDALAAARARKADALLVDTAGRLHTHGGLMDELAKIARVVRKHHEGAPHETLLVLDATVGQNGLVQAREFAKYVSPTGIVLAKMDSTARGGIVVALRHELGIPVKLVGTGESSGDLATFDPDDFIRGVFSGP